MGRKKKLPPPTATLQDGTSITIGDEVTTEIYDKCKGEVFVVMEIHQFPLCASGTMVVVHLKGDPERQMRGFHKEGWVRPAPDGIDAHWFAKVK